jgi:hypothetical protein
VASLVCPQEQNTTLRTVGSAEESWLWRRHSRAIPDHGPVWLRSHTGFMNGAPCPQIASEWRDFHGGGTLFPAEARMPETSYENAGQFIACWSSRRQSSSRGAAGRCEWVAIRSRGIPHRRSPRTWRSFTGVAHSSVSFTFSKVDVGGLRGEKVVLEREPGSCETRCSMGMEFARPRRAGSWPDSDHDLHVQAGRGRGFPSPRNQPRGSVR